MNIQNTQQRETHTKTQQVPQSTVIWGD